LQAYFIILFVVTITHALLFLLFSGHTDVVRVLLQDFKGIRIDQPNRLGFTALMKAAIQGRTDCARLLLYAGWKLTMLNICQDICQRDRLDYLLCALEKCDV
jgi:hypothetical protein